MNLINLIGDDGQAYEWRPSGRSVPVTARKGFSTRRVFAAAHVVADPVTASVDWEATMAFRHHLWGLGFGVAEAMDTAQRGYWGSDDSWTALETVLALAAAHPDRIDGVKISLLDDKLEKSMRGRLPEGVRTYTGDDFNFVDMILGDEDGHSDALLGVFDPIAPVASAAFEALDAGDRNAFGALLDPTIPFARHLFSAPTYHYKTGITFLAFLNGHQNHFRMLGGAENARSMAHLSRLLVLADEAALLVDPDLALQRMGHLLSMSGFE